MKKTEIHSKKSIAISIKNTMRLAVILMSFLGVLPSWGIEQKEQRDLTNAVNCSDLDQRFMQWAEVHRQSSEQVSQYLMNLSEIIKAWHQGLAPLEGKEVFISKGSFDPMGRTVDHVFLSSQTVKKNGEDFFVAMKQLIEELKNCLK